MKNICMLVIITAISGALGCTGVNTVPKNVQSENFDSIASHLDLGGDVYGYVDLNGDMKKTSVFLNELLTKIDDKHIPADIKAKIDFVELFDELGLSKLQAMGCSSVKSGDMYTNKTFIKTDGLPSGVLGIFGDESTPLVGPNLAPAGAALIIEQNIKLKTLYHLLLSVIGKFIDKTELKRIQQELDEPLVPGLFTINELLDGMDTKIVIIVDINKEKTINVLDGQASFLQFEALISIDNMGFVLDKLFEMASVVPVFETSKNEHWQTIEFVEELPGDLSLYKPVLRRDLATNRLYIATRMDFLNECVSGKNSLGSSSSYNQLASKIGITQGTALAYLSPAINDFAASLAKNASKLDNELRFVNDIVDFLLAEIDQPQLAITTVTDDGIWTVGQSTFSHKFNLAYIGLMVPAYSAGIAAAIAADKSQDDCTEALEQMQLDEEYNNQEEDQSGGD